MFESGEFKKFVAYQKQETSKEQEPILKELLGKIEGIKKQENTIGEGATAKVFASQTNPDVCYKIIHGSGDYNYRNSVETESSLLEKAEKISQTTGVKIPKPFYSITTNENNPFEVLVMERIKGVSIKDIIENDLDVSENFNFQAFVAKVEAFFQKLHDNNIFHRDAHWGNIMIEDETNTPCIIDFGASTELLLNSEDPYTQVNFNGDAIKFTLDEYRVRDELRMKFRMYLFKKYGNIHNL